MLSAPEVSGLLPGALAESAAVRVERRSGALERGGVVERGPATIRLGSLWFGVVVCAGTRGCKRRGPAGWGEEGAWAMGKGAGDALGQGKEPRWERRGVLDGKRGKG